MRPHLSMRWRGWPAALGRALLPSVCALCGFGCDAVVCPACLYAYATAQRPRCRCCANPLGGLAPADGQPAQDLAALLCGSCLVRRPAFDATVAALDYAAPLDALVLQLKFGARLALAPWFAQMLRDAVLARHELALPDMLCPVPLSPQRLVERGFNQALEIARPLAASLGIALQARLAARTVDTRAQSSVAPSERQQNMRGAFVVTLDAIDLVAGRHVGVVDDVMTSGHTLGELAATLKRYGATRVTNLVFARTPPH